MARPWLPTASYRGRSPSKLRRVEVFDANFAKTCTRMTCSLAYNVAKADVDAGTADQDGRWFLIDYGPEDDNAENPDRLIGTQWPARIYVEWYERVSATGYSPATPGEQDWWEDLLQRGAPGIYPDVLRT